MWIIVASPSYTKKSLGNNIDVIKKNERFLKEIKPLPVLKNYDGTIKLYYLNYFILQVIKIASIRKYFASKLFQHLYKHLHQFSLIAFSVYVSGSLSFSYPQLPH